MIVYEYDRAGIAALEHIPKDMPMVVVGGSFGDGDYQIINAERDGGRWMTMHLLDLGHRTVFHVGRPAGPTANTRTNGWRDALEERGIAAPDPIIVPDDDLDESVKAGRVLGRRDEVTAIFADNDEIAVAVIRGLREVGRRVPDDVSVVGFDDRNFGAMWNPALTSYTQNFLDMGERSFRMLFERIQAKRTGDGMPPSQVEVVQGEPCLRASERAYDGGEAL